MMQNVKACLCALIIAITCVQCGGPPRPCKPAPKPLPRSPREPGLAGRWTFDAVAGHRACLGDVVHDSSGRRAHGKAFEVGWVTGAHSQAGQFVKPRSRVQIPCTPELNLADAVTIMAWIQPQDVRDESRVIVAKNDEYALRIDNPREGGRISFFVHVGSPAVTWEPRVSSREPPLAGAWTHVAAVWDGQESRLYINGELANTRARSGRSNPNPYPVMIGNWEYPSCHGGSFGGPIDDVRIYQRALTAEEVAAHVAARP